MRNGNNLKKNRSKSVQIRKRQLTPEDNCTLNNPRERECSDNSPVTTERSQTNATAYAASSPANERRSSFTIRTPLILEARDSKSNWFQPSKKTKVDLFQDFPQYSNNGFRSPYFNDEDSQPGLTSSVVSRRKDIKAIHGDSGGKQNDSSIKTVASSQDSKRKLANGNNLSAPTSKRLRSAKKDSQKQNKKKLDKPQIKSLLLNRSRPISKTIVKEEHSTTSKNSSKTSQESKRKLANGNNLSAPTSKRLRSAKKDSQKQNQKKLDKPQIKSLLLNRSRPISKTIVKEEHSTTSKNSLKTNHASNNISSTSKSYSTICSNRQRSQSKRSSKTKSARKSKKRNRSSKSSTKRTRQSLTSAAKRRKSKKTSTKPRKSKKTSKSRTQSKQRRSTKNKVVPRNVRIESTEAKSKRKEARGERIATERESKARRLHSKKTEPLKVKLKETLKEKKAIKKAPLTTKRISVSRKDKLRLENRKNTTGKVSDTNYPPDVVKLSNKIESLSEQGDSYNTPKEQIVTMKADVEIQCCLLMPSQCLPNTRAQSMTNESMNSNNFVNESSAFGEQSVSTQELKIGNSDQEALCQKEQRVVNMNGDMGVNSQSHPLTLNPDLSLLNSGGPFSMMKEQTTNPTSSFGELGEYNGNLSEQNGKISNLDGQATTRKEIEHSMIVSNQIFVCNQSPATLAMESRNADIMGEQIKNPSNSFKDSRELNEHHSNPPEERRNFDLKSFMQNETKANVLNIDDHVDRNSQSHSLTSAQDLQFNPGIDSEPMETRANPNNCFGESSKQFLNPPEKSNRNLDEQMNVRNTTKEHLMIIDKPVEAQQHNFQSVMIQNLPIQSGVAIDMVEENENSSKLNGQWNEYTTKELRNEISSNEQTDPNNCFGESSKQFLNPPEKSNRNLDEQMNVRITTKEHLMIIDKPVEAQQHNFQSVMIQNLPIQSGVAIDMVEENENSSKLNGQWNEYTTKELRNEISSNEQTDPNNCFGESSKQFLNPPEKSNRNLDEQMNVRITTKEHLMIIDKPVEAQQHNFQSVTIQNLPIQSGVAIDMVEENENSSKLNGQWNEYTTKELRNEISSNEQTDANNKTEQSLLNADDHTEIGSQSHSTESFQSLSPTHSVGTKEMMSKGKIGSVSSLNEPKRLTEQLSDIPDDGSIYLDEQVCTNNEIEQCSMNVCNQAEDSQPHFKSSAHNLTLADVVAKVMNENIQPRSSSKKLNGHFEKLSKCTENINRDSNQQVSNEFHKSPLSFKLHKTPHSQSMALLPYEPSRFVLPLRETATSGFNSSESGFNEQFSNSLEEIIIINEVGESLLELVSVSLSQGASPEDITYSPDQSQEIESQIRTLRCIYIQESDSIPEDDTVPVNYIRTSPSLLLQGLPNWLKKLYNNLFCSKK